jgi:N-acetylglucosaminyldiphosphoundecaprenol N-acetyl-beta-D-mannosaminyltransferase
MEMIFGVPIEGSHWEDIKTRLEAGHSLWMVTANPEIMLEARENKNFREAIKRANLRLVDGFGLFLATRVLRLVKLAQDTFSFSGKSVLRRTPTLELRRAGNPVRLTGVQLAEHLLQLAWKHEWRIGFFGGEHGEAERAAEDARLAYKGIHIHVEQGGSVMPDGKEDSATEEARHRMSQFSPHVLLVAMGHPRQELWIDQHRNEFPELKAIVGVGGTFMYWSGYSKRPPVWMKSFGLEWLWRLITEPKRWKRIWRAVVVFPILFLLG